MPPGHMVAQGSGLLGTHGLLLRPCQGSWCVLLVPVALAPCPHDVVLASGLLLVQGTILGVLERPTAAAAGPAPPLGTREVIPRAVGGETRAVGPPAIAKATGPIAQGAPIAHITSITEGTAIPKGATIAPTAPQTKGVPIAPGAPKARGAPKAQGAPTAPQTKGASGAPGAPIAPQTKGGPIARGAPIAQGAPVTPIASQTKGALITPGAPIPQGTPRGPHTKGAPPIALQASGTEGTPQPSWP